MEEEWEPEAGPTNPRLWLFYHVAMKGLQAGAISGLAIYILRIPSMAKSVCIQII